MTNTFVTLYKFGYQPTNDTKSMSSENIYKTYNGNEDVEIRMLGEVQMKLERKKDDGTWAEWNPNTDNWGTGAFATEKNHGACPYILCGRRRS